jgi:polyisoprenyl-teichoic acid--peptidoglycan teichoic acid transferase
MRRKRALLLTAVSIVACGVLLGATLAVGLLVFGPEERAGAAWLTVTKVGESHYSTSPTEPTFIAIIGNDKRSGPDAGVSPGLGDALHVVGVNPVTKQATILNFPRDLEVEIPGVGTDKINAAFAYGGLPLQVETLSNLIGVPIPYAVTTNFDGFINLVDEMGGVDVVIPKDLNDTNSGAVFPAGPAHLDGNQALAFARDRYDFERGDIDRTGNQAYLMISALAQLRQNYIAPSGTLRLLAVMGRNTEIQGLGIRELYDLTRLALAIDPATIGNITPPTGTGSGSNLALGSGADAIFADFRDDGVVAAPAP